jgi:hypothetical protein
MIEMYGKPAALIQQAASRSTASKRLTVLQVSSTTNETGLSGVLRMRARSTRIQPGPKACILDSLQLNTLFLLYCVINSRAHIRSRWNQLRTVSYALTKRPCYETSSTSLSPPNKCIDFRRRDVEQPPHVVNSASANRDVSTWVMTHSKLFVWNVALITQNCVPSDLMHRTRVSWPLRA